MPERNFQHYIFDPLIRKRLDEYLDRKRRRGLTVEVIKRPFQGHGKYPVAVVKIGGGEARLFYSPEGRWKVRCRMAIYNYNATPQEVAPAIARQRKAERAGARRAAREDAKMWTAALQEQLRLARECDLDREIEGAAALLLRWVR